jgi:PAS domain S-box-containing protein
MKSNTDSVINASVIRSFSIVGTSFFFLTTLLAAFVIIPKINGSIESQYLKDSQIELKLETELFKRFVESQKTILQDLAKFPSLTNAVMLSDGTNRATSDLFNNVVIGGEKGKLVLQDIEGTVLIKTANSLQGYYGNTELWVEEMLDGSLDYYFRLLDQSNDAFTFQLSIPVTYGRFIEGLLSAEITVSFSQVFVTQTVNKQIAFRLTQDQSTIFTPFEHIEIVREHVVELDLPNLTFIYITDDGPIRKEAHDLRNTVLLVLLIGLAVSFILYALMGYRNFAASSQSLNTKRYFWTAYTMPIFVGTIGVAASLAAQLIIMNIQQSSTEARLVVDSKATIRLLKNKLNSNLAVLDSVKAFYDASVDVSRLDFKTFVQPLLKNHQKIQALEWVPYVPDSLRHEYETPSNGLKEFVIKERNINGDFIPSVRKDNYFPIYFVEPLQGNENTLGFDLSSSSKRMEGLIKARDTGKKTATGSIELVQETNTQEGLLLFNAVYESTIQPADLPDRQRLLKGFVVMVLKASDLVRESIGYSFEQTLFIRDITDNANVDVIFGIEPESDAFRRTETIDVAGRQWKVVTSSSFTEIPLWWISWLVLFSGLIFTTLIIIGLVNLIHRREVVELLVKQRTAELRVLSSTVANANDVFIITEAQSFNDENMGPRITYVNEAFTRLTGYLSEEALGKTPRMLQGKHTDRKELDKIRTALEQGRPYLGELLNYTKDGKEYWVEVNISALKNSKGEITHFSAVERDISERKLAQQEREKMVDKLMDSNEELERFAFVCSHDLQEPLRMIRSFSEKLQAHISNTLENDEKGKRYFHFVTDGAARAQALIADILAYSSIGTDTQQLEDVRGNDLVNIIKDNMQDSLQESGGSITCQELPMLRGNKTQLFQLFQNLINNGMKYQKPDTVPKLQINVESFGSFWKFSIKDNGIGMEEKHLKKIFEVFQRLHRKNQYAGTGVGLSICRKVAERHGGTIWAESKKGTGSTFYFTLLKTAMIEASDEQKH